MHQLQRALLYVVLYFNNHVVITVTFPLVGSRGTNSIIIIEQCDCVWQVRTRHFTSTIFYCTVCTTCYHVSALQSWEGQWHEAGLQMSCKDWRQSAEADCCRSEQPAAGNATDNQWWLCGWLEMMNVRVCHHAELINEIGRCQSIEWSQRAVEVSAGVVDSSRAGPISHGPMSYPSMCNWKWLIVFMHVLPCLNNLLSRWNMLMLLKIMHLPLMQC